MGPPEMETTKPNQFTGVRTAALEAKLRKLERTVAKIANGDEEGGGGSPLEGLYDQIEDIEVELHQRNVEIS
jgi:hypothetical protein